MLSPRRLGHNLHAQRARIGRISGIGAFADHEEKETPFTRQLAAATTSPKRKIGSVAGSSSWDSFGDTEDELAVVVSFRDSEADNSGVSDDGSARKHRRKSKNNRQYNRKLAGYQSSGCAPPPPVAKYEDFEQNLGGQEDGPSEQGTSVDFTATIATQ